MSVSLGVYGITQRYGAREVLKEISFEVEKGEILSLLGPNGSGKSTLLKIVSGILPLGASGAAGQVRIAGEDSRSGGAAWRARHLTYVPADLRAEFPITAWEAVWMGRICYGGSPSREGDRALVQQAMERCLCWGFRDQLLHRLSGGERQLVALARAYAQAVKVLLIDEGLSRMDLNHQAAMGRTLRRFADDGGAVILVSHDLNVATEWADTALLLLDGKIAAHGAVKEVVSDRRIAALYPGAALSVRPSPTSGAPKVYFGSQPKG